ncbi:3-oxoacyl-[acyl-carrier-protein] reductase [Hydrogenispora ethanolica]|uniref:3-oxoacyl-[acyl-carrier-protein] reductase n=1 Tax=Hydrogenispora ethanolica TaxID=1082276 RepID=A0A4R1QZ91_HYDET|nr:3-oxoacyl-[acyl-carrier-protein] reductase [Hydrogenispora ethanolica]TCL58300.1 3-oxoacyl-[acyl-carrier-protein] reductase [Hydrogenispora ethanolica]
MRLAREVAIVTGAARGIGKSIALALVREGAIVVISDINEEIHQVAEEINRSGGQAVAVVGNVTKMADCETLVDTAVKQFGKIDILVNNAGITKDNLLLRMSEEDWDAVLTINLKGTFLCTKAAIKPMMKQRSGKIINIASVIGQMGNPGQANYAASKGGVIAFTKTMAKELGSRNIRVNAIAPGFIESKMTEVLSEEAKANLTRLIPLGTLGKPDYVAEAVVFLASPAACYTTGQVLNVDGGMVM